MKKLILLLVFVLFCGKSFADWKFLEIAEAIEGEYYIDFDKTEKDENGYIIFWLLVDKKVKHPDSDVWSFIEQAIIDCNNFRTQTLKHYLYPERMAKGKIIKETITELEKDDKYWDYHKLDEKNSSYKHNAHYVQKV